MYRSLPSFREYVLISQNEPIVEVFRKQDEQHWLYQITQGLEAELMLQTIEHSISLESIYAKVAFNHPSE